MSVVGCDRLWSVVIGGECRDGFRSLVNQGFGAYQTVPQAFKLPFFRIFCWVHWFCKLKSAPPKRGRKTSAARKLSKNVENIIEIFLTPLDVFWRFLPCAKNVKKCLKIFWTLFDDFWFFLTWPFPLAPFAVHWLRGESSQITVGWNSFWTWVWCIMLQIRDWYRFSNCPLFSNVCSFLQFWRPKGTQSNNPKIWSI